MQPGQHSALFRWMVKHWLFTFLIMTGCFVGSGLASFNLVMLVSANASFFIRHGLDAVVYGGLLQLAELAMFALVAVAFYFLFKFSENALLERFAYRRM